MDFMVHVRAMHLLLYDYDGLHKTDLERWGMSWKKPGVGYFALLSSPSSIIYTHHLVHGCEISSDLTGAQETKSYLKLPNQAASLAL